MIQHELASPEPSRSSVLALKSLADLDVRRLKGVVFRIELGGLSYLCRLRRGEPSSDRLLVMLGAHSPAGEPSFGYFNAGCRLTRHHILAISDPTLLLRPAIQVGCFLGRRRSDAVTGAIVLARHVGRAFGAAAPRTVFIGHSGAGFGALMAACRWGGTGAATNPFLDLGKVARTPMTARIADVFETGASIQQLRNDHPLRASVVEALDAARRDGANPRLVVAQNVKDGFVYEQHFLRLLAELGTPERAALAPLVSGLTFEAANGHGRPDDQVFKRVLDRALA